MQFDVNEMRRSIIEHEDLECIDEAFTFYYDESNNFRKLHLTNKGLNIGKSCNFVLAGILHKGEVHSADFDTLKGLLKIQKSAAEIKLKHIGKGDFLEILESEKLGILLNWLIEEEFYIHYFSLNVLYWSIIDIVDSIIENLNFSNKLFYSQSHMLVKSDLYKTIVNDEAFFLEALREFEYPNIKEDKVEKFTDFLINFVRKNSIVLDDNRRILLNTFMDGAKGASELFFIMNERDHILISNLFPYYLRNTYLFKNSKHIFDEEKVIEDIFANYDLVDDESVIKNYSFVPSKSVVEVQISDILAGLLAKYATFISDTEKSEIAKIKNDLNEIQSANLTSFEKLIDKSDQISRGFIYRTISEDEYIKSDYFIHNRELR